MKISRLAIAAVLFVIASCGGGGGYGGSSPPPPPVQNASPGGIWTGTDTSNGATVEGLVDEVGEANFIDSNGVQYVVRNAFSISGNTATGTFDGYAPFGTTFADGSAHGVGTFSGTIQERSSFSGNTSFTTDGGSTVTGALNLTFNALYDEASATSDLAGMYIDSATGVVVTVDVNGNIFAQDQNTGCVLNGTESAIDTAFNAYRVSISFASCTGASAVLNGLTLQGLATLDDQVTPKQVVAGLSGPTTGGGSIAVTYLLTSQ